MPLRFFFKFVDGLLERLKEAAAELLVRLDVVAFTPFVPGLYEHYPLVVRLVGYGRENLLAMGLEKLRGGVFDYDPVPAGTRRVVPVREDGGEYVLADHVLVEIVLYRALVAVHARDAEVLLSGLPDAADKTRLRGVDMQEVARVDPVEPKVDVTVMESLVGVILVLEDEVNPLEALLHRQFPPDREEFLHLLGDEGHEDHEERLPLDGDVAVVLESRQDFIEMPDIVFLPRIGLLDHYLPVDMVLSPEFLVPVVVGPRKAEREIRLARCKYLVERSFQHPLAVPEPIVPVAESLDAVFPGQVGLGYAAFRKPEVVETKVLRDPRLAVSREQGLRAGDADPFRVAFSPEPVVLRGRVELRQVQRNRPYLLHIHIQFFLKDRVLSAPRPTLLKYTVLSA